MSDPAEQAAPPAADAPSAPNADAPSAPDAPDDAANAAKKPSTALLKNTPEQDAQVAADLGNMAPSKKSEAPPEAPPAKKSEAPPAAPPAKKSEAPPAAPPAKKSAPSAAAAPKEAAPKEAAPKEAAPKETAPKEAAPKEAAAKKPMSADSLFKPTKDAFNEEWMEYFKSSKLPEALPIKFGIIGPGGISSKFVQAVNFSNQMWKDALALPAKKDALKITAFGVRDSYNIYQLASKQKAYVESRKGQEDRFAGDVAGHEAWANEADAWMTATKLIASKKVDIVYISASTTAKKDYALKCLEGGKSIIVEKPFMKANDVAEIAQKAKEKGLLFMDGTMFAHSPRLLHLRKHVPTKYLLQTEGSFTLYRPWCEDTAAGKAHADSRVDPKLEPHGALGDLGWYNIRFALWAYNWELPETVHCIPTSTKSVNNGVPLQASVFMSWENKDGNAKLPRRSSNFTCSFVTGEGQRQSFLLGDYEEFDVSGIVSTDQKKQYLVEVEDFIVASNPAITNPTPQSIKKTTFAWGQGPWAILKKSENITTEEKFGETNCMANLPDVVLWVSNFARMHTMRVLDPEETHTRDSLADIASQTPTKDITTTLTVPMFSNHPKHFRNISAGMKAASYQTQLVLDAACESFKDGHERVYNKKEKKYVCKPRVMVTGNGEIVRTKEDLAAANQGCSCTIM